MQRFFILILLMNIHVLCQMQSMGSWTLVASPVESHEWWIKGRSMKGNQVTWQIKEIDHVKVLKVKIFQNETSHQYTELEIQIDSKQRFNLDYFSAQVLVTFRFYEMSRLVKEWRNNNSNLFKILIHNRELVINGSDFYFSIKFAKEFVMNYIILIYLAFIIFTKNWTIITFGSFTLREIFIVPVILPYFILFPKGFLLSSKDFLFQESKDVNMEMMVLILIAIWFPCVMYIFKLFNRALQMRWKNQLWKVISLSLFATGLSSFGIFYEANQISLLLLFVIEMAIPKHHDSSTISQFFKKASFIADLLIYLYIWYTPIYPGRVAFIHSNWKYAIVFIFLFEAFQCFWYKTSYQENTSEPIQNITNKKKKKKGKKEE